MGSNRFSIAWICAFALILLGAKSAFAQSDDIVTPIVTIIDVNPDSRSDRVTRITSILSQVDAIVGENIIFECSVLYLQPGKPILWKKNFNGTSMTLNDGLKSLDSSKYRISQGTSQTSIRLEVMSVNLASAGTYACEVFYDDRSAEIRRSRKVDVYEPPRFSVRDTSFETTARVGDPVRLRCGAVGRPQPLLYWHRSAGSSSVIRNYGRQVEGSEILFPNVSPGDRGTYICNAVNRVASGQWPVRLSVTFPPVVRFENGAAASQKPGCTLELLCVIEANPVPLPEAVQVTKAGDTLVDGQDGVNIVHMKGADSTLYVSVYIFPFRESHAGTYGCSATNNVIGGSNAASITVTASSSVVPGRSGAAICDACSLAASSLLLLLSAACAAFVSAWR